MLASEYYEKYINHIHGKYYETTVQHRNKAKPLLYHVNRKVGQLKVGENIIIDARYDNQYDLPNHRVKILYGGDQFDLHINCIKKLIKKDRLGIHSSKLILGGFYNGVNFEDKFIPCYQFHSKKQIIDSILKGLITNPMIGKEVIDDLETFLNNPTQPHVWSSCIDQDEINEIGKYVGELLIGILAFDGYFEDFKDVKVFSVPDVHNYPLIDSIIDSVGISSKYGQGAPTSLLANVVYKMLDRKLEPCVLKDLIECTSEEKNHRIYEYADKHIFKFDCSPVEAYERAISDDAKSLKSIINHIKENTDKLKIRDNLPNTITAYFADVIRTRINNCERSKSYIKEFLSQKKVIQINLGKSLWNNGRIDCKIHRLHEMAFRCDRGKFKISDNQAKGGALVYELRPIPRVLSQK